MLRNGKRRAIADTVAAPVQHAPAQVEQPALVEQTSAFLDAPALWLAALVHEHQDADGRKELSRTCKAAQTLVMASTPKLTMQLVLRGKKQDQHSVDSAQHQLSQCGRQVHTLRLQTGTPTPGTSHLGKLLQGPLQSHLKHLILADAHAATAFHQYTSGVFPDLTHLTVHSDSPSMPKPQRLPTLSTLHLTLSNPQEGSPDPDLTSVGPYAPQLQHLTIRGRGELYRVLQQQVLTATTHTLVTLDLPNTALGTFITTLLLTHTPALRHLSVDYVGLGAAVVPGSKWHVGDIKAPRLTVDILEQVTFLPRMAEGRTTMRYPENTAITVDKGHILQAAAVVDALRSFTLPGCTKILLAELPASAEPYSAADTEAFFSIVRAVQPAPTEMALHHIEVSASVLAALAAPSPANVTVGSSRWAVDPATPLDDLPCVQGISQLQLPECNLDDRVLSVLLRCSPQLKQLTVARVQLCKADSNCKTWRVDTLTVKSAVQLSMLAYAPKAGTSAPRLWSRGIICDVLDDSVLAAVKRRVHSFNMLDKILDLKPWLRLQGLGHCGYLTTLENALRLPLGLADVANDCLPPVRLSAWTVTSLIIDHLATLSKSVNSLHLVECLLPLFVDDCKRLLARLPSSIKEVYLEPRPPGPQLQQIIAGAPKRLLVLRFGARDPELQALLVQYRTEAGISPGHLKFKFSSPEGLEVF